VGLEYKLTATDSDTSDEYTGSMKVQYARPLSKELQQLTSTHHFMSYVAACHTKVGLISEFRREAEENGTDRVSQIVGNMLLPHAA